MAENVGWATLDIVPSARGIAASIDKQTRGEMAKAGARGGRQFGDAAGKEASGRFKSRMGTTVRDLFAPAAGLLAGAGIIEGFRAVVSAASDAQQSVGGVQAVFGEYAKQVQRDSGRADEALGLSANAYRELITVSGAMLKNKGLEDFAEQATNLVQVGADLAAQFGGSTRDAVDALNAAMRGESDPIERYGISLNETAVNAVLAANGTNKLKGAALEQAKTQARLTLIQKQSADAQGAFARESDTLAGKQQRLAAQWDNMQAEIGGKLLPALTSVAGVMNDNVLPALGDAGGVVVDAAKAFDSLPPPVKAAAAALAAFRSAQLLGITGGAARGLSSMSSGMDSLRLRAMLAADEYRSLRSASLTFNNGAPRFTAASGRMSSSLGALRTAAAGAGAGLRRGLGGAMNLIGGPWAIAIAAGAFAVGKFMSANADAKQFVEDLSDSLDKQTGAITDNTRALVFNDLQKSGAIDAAKELGLSLVDVKMAAEGNAGALEQVLDVARQFSGGRGLGGAKGDPLGISGWFGGDKQDAANTLIDSLGDVKGALGAAKGAAADYRDFSGDVKGAQEKVTASFVDYRGKIDDAREALQKLLDKENERRDKNLSAFDAQTRLASAIRDASKEAAKGAHTLDKNTEAGEANRNALSALADQWNSAPASVQRAQGAYENIRQKFIDIADQMNGPGGTREAAQRMADQFLRVPKNVNTKFSTPGMDEARAKIKALQDELKRAQQLATIRLRVIGPGDISRPEFGHGVGNQPYASPNTPSRTSPMFDFRGSTIEAHDYDDFTRQMQRRARSRVLDNWGG